jgi:hypothetical protein
MMCSLDSAPRRRQSILDYHQIHGGFLLFAIKQNRGAEIDKKVLEF